MTRPPSNGMCVICKAVPAERFADGRTKSYCVDCELKYQRERYHKKNSATKGIGRWGNKGPKSPPVDWREVLRKADEAKS